VARSLTKLLLLLLLLPLGAGAELDETPLVVNQNLPLPDLTKMPAYGGVDPKPAARFWDTWHLVTTRFRRDNEQLRFVYANDVAWKAMQKRPSKYPDGAMFAKVAFLPEPDPTFPSSAVPTHFVRVQLMKKDARVFAATDGWGYGVYSQPGTDATPAQQEQTVRACHACHQLVPKKDFVFSEPLFSPWPAVPPTTSSPYAGQFVKRSARELSPFELKALASVRAEAATDVMRLSMPLFRGSLGESIGTLAGFSNQSQQPYLLVDSESELFLVTKPLPPRAGCTSLAQFMLTVQGPSGALRDLKGGEVCDGKVEWKERRRLE
jgi:hypothetical protein